MYAQTTWCLLFPKNLSGYLGVKCPSGSPDARCPLVTFVDRSPRPGPPAEATYYCPRKFPLRDLLRELKGSHHQEVGRIILVDPSEICECRVRVSKTKLSTPFRTYIHVKMSRGLIRLHVNPGSWLPERRNIKVTDS